MIPKRLGPKPLAKLFIQFDINLTTNLDLKLTKNGEKYKQDEIVQDGGHSVHKLKMELLLAESNYQALLHTDYKADLGSFKNYLSEPDVKIIDLDGFMKGNPLLKGMM